MKTHNHFDIHAAKRLLACALGAVTLLALPSCADQPRLPAPETTTENTDLVETTDEIAMSPVQTEASLGTTTQVPVRIEPTAPVVRTETTETREEIPFEVIYEYSEAHYEGTEITKQEGIVGELCRVTVTTFTNDEVTNTDVTETVLVSPTEKIVIVGTKEEITNSYVLRKENYVEFEIVYRYDETAYDDERHVVQNGERGYDRVTYLVTYRKGEEIGRELYSRFEIAPREEIIRVGTIPAWTEKRETVRGKELPFATEYIYDDSLPEGERYIKTAGKNGYTEEVYTLHYYKGELSSKEKIDTITHAPENEVVVIGTKKTEERFGLPFYTGQGYYMSQDYHSGHGALDFAIWYGDPILAVGGGTVIFAYDEGYFSKNDLNWTYGTFVMIEHDNGLRSLYAHLADRNVSIGDRVEKGDVIGTSGNTGRVNPMPTPSNPLAGTHLHFEIRENRNGSYVRVDPKDYLPDF